MNSLRKIQEKYAASERLVALTAYDALTAGWLAEAGVDLILVGDSLSNVVAGYDSTIPVTMDQMLWHVQMTVRGAGSVPVVADMPFMSYEISREQALANAARFVKEGGATAVKLEGGGAVVETVRALTGAHIPVCGHLGLQPQSVLASGRYAVHGREAGEAERIKKEALALQEAGAFAVVLEMVPLELAREVTASLSIPTIGIGAGPHCSGQILVTQDLLGFTGQEHRFLRRYAEVGAVAREALSAYVRDVKAGLTPDEEHSFQK